MNRIIKYLLPLIVIGAWRMPLFANEPINNISKPNSPIQLSTIDVNGAKKILGTVSYRKPEAYAAIKQTETGEQYIYRKGDYLNNELRITEINNDLLNLWDEDKKRQIILRKGVPSGGIEFVEMSELDTFEYWYRMAGEGEEIQDKMFKLVRIINSKAVLERDYRGNPLSAEGPLAQDNPSVLADTYKPAVDEVFFNQLVTKYMGHNTWIVDGNSVTKNVVEDSAAALTETAKGIKGLSYGKEGFGLKLAAKSGKGSLDKRGCMVNELSPDVRAKAGLRDGDIIKAINGKSVSNIIDVIFIYLEVKNDNVTTLTVDLLRDAEEVKNTYVIN